jgi:imidazolonepropionase
MIIHSASQVLTLKGGPQRGGNLGRISLIEDGAVLFQEGVIKEIGKSTDLLAAYPDETRLDAGNQVVMPGFVDPHTHLVWAGNRASEFELRVQGKSYQEIMAAGGGIVSTVKNTRSASVAELKAQSRKRLETLLSQGTTTLEAKTGYGLNLETELKILQVLLELNQEGPQDLEITFLAAHAVPEEYAGKTQAYTDLVSDEMLPALARWWPEHTLNPLPFVDIFCETGAFDLEQSRQVLKKALDLSFPVKIHADEFDNLGGAALAAELGAVSADHLVVTSSGDIEALGKSDTVAVSLPCTPFGLGHHEYTPAGEILKSNGLLAIATDLNPGTAWCGNMQFAVALACRFLHLTPAQAIAAATINAAAAIGRDGQVGSLEPGKQADILILDIPDYRHLGYRFGGNLVQTVIKKGKLVWKRRKDEFIG